MTSIARAYCDVYISWTQVSKFMDFTCWIIFVNHWCDCIIHESILHQCVCNLMTGHGHCQRFFWKIHSMKKWIEIWMQVFVIGFWKSQLDQLQEWRGVQQYCGTIYMIYKCIVNIKHRLHSWQQTLSFYLVLTSREVRGSKPEWKPLSL